MQAMTGAMAIQGAWLACPDDLRSQMPRDVIHHATIALLVLGILGRLIKQGDAK